MFLLPWQQAPQPAVDLRGTIKEKDAGAGHSPPPKPFVITPIPPPHPSGTATSLYREETLCSSQVQGGEEKGDHVPVPFIHSAIPAASIGNRDLASWAASICLRDQCLAPTRYLINTCHGLGRDRQGRRETGKGNVWKGDIVGECAELEFGGS